MAEQQPLLPSPNDAEHESTGLSVTEERKKRLGEALESRRWHKLVLTFIAIDAICVLADLSYTFLSDSCAPDHEEEPDWLRVFAITSLVITSIFLIEIPLHIYTFSFKYYNPMAKGPDGVHSSLHLLDAAVIVVTFVIEVFLRGRERELASLLILFRLWRLVKLVSGVAVGVGETSEQDAKRLYELEADVRAKQSQLVQLEKENKALKEQLAQVSTSADNSLFF